MVDDRVRYLLTAEDQTKGAFQSVRSNLEATSTAISQIRSVGATFIGAQALGELRQVGDAIVAARIQSEKLTNTLTQAVGAGGLRSEMGFLREQANRLGLEFNSTAESYAKFASAARGTALEGGQTRDIFIGVAQASAALGLSADETAGALTAVQQIISKGKVSAEELRGQLGERLPGAFQIAARSIGVTTQQLDALLSTGSLIADDFLPRFGRQLQVEFADASARAATSTQGSVNRLQTAWNDLKAVVANSPAGDAAATGLSNLATNIQNVADRFRNASREANGFFDWLGIIAREAPIGLAGIAFARRGDELAQAGSRNNAVENAYSTFQRDAQREFPPRPTVSSIRAIDNQQVPAIVSSARSDVQKLIDQLRTPQQQLQQQIEDLKRLGSLSGVDVSGAISEARRRAGASAAKDAERELDARRALDELIAQSTADDNLRQQAEQTEAAANASLLWLRRLDEAEQAANDVIRANERQSRSYIDLIDPSARYVRQLEEIRRLSKLSPGEGGLTTEQALSAEFAVQNAWQDSLDKGKDKLASTKDAARDLGFTFQSAFEDAVIGGKNLSDVLKGLAQDVSRVFLRETVSKPLAASASKLFEGIFSGGASAGPELLNSFSTPVAVKSASAPSVVNNITVSGEVSRADVYGAVAAAEMRTKAAILDSMRRNGAFARA